MKLQASAAQVRKWKRHTTILASSLRCRREAETVEANDQLTQLWFSKSIFDRWSKIWHNRFLHHEGAKTLLQVHYMPKIYFKDRVTAKYNIQCCRFATLGRREQNFKAKRHRKTIRKQMFYITLLLQQVP